MAKDASQSVAELNTCVSTSNGSRPAKETTFREWMLANQIGTEQKHWSSHRLLRLARSYLNPLIFDCIAGISLTILSMLLAVHHLYPSLRPYTTPFFQLSYYDSSRDAYVQGLDDIYFVFSSAIAFTAVRAIVIDWVFQPTALYCGLKKKASVRFAEQAWLMLYYAFFWSFGMVSICRSYLFCLSNRSV